MGFKGIGDGQFQGPEGIDVDSLSNVYVADTKNARVENSAATAHSLQNSVQKADYKDSLCSPTALQRLKRKFVRVWHE
jgi:hypothetical protein